MSSHNHPVTWSQAAFISQASSLGFSSLSWFGKKRKKQKKGYDFGPQTHTHTHRRTRYTHHPPLSHTLVCINNMEMTEQKAKKQGQITESTGMTSKWMGLTAACCRWIVLQHSERDKIDESTDWTQWTGQRARALKRRLGEATEGKWKKINRRIKQLMRH